MSAAFARHDRALALGTEAVSIPGVELDVAFHEPGDMFRRMCVDQAFDLSEMSLGAHCFLTGAGDSPFVGLPAFPSRAFRHSMVFVNADSGIQVPADLNGKRIGIREWGMTAVVWIIGILGEHYGFEMRSAQWLAAQPPRVPIPMPEGSVIHRLPAGQTLSGWLETGEIDAAFLLSPPQCTGQGGTRVRRLFEDYAAEERRWFARTGLHPIMHTVVLRRSLHEAHAGLARRLYGALCQAREHARALLADPGVPSVMLPFLHAYLDETLALFGDDYWPYGVDANREELRCLLRYAHEQALIPHPLPVEALFAQELTTAT